MPVPERGGMQRGLAALSLSLLAVSLWALTHRYRGLTGDAELYALQALSRLHPALATDIYLQNVSQDRYTVFSRLYAMLIGVAGLHAAACGLFLAFTAAFLAAAWALARRLAGADAAWLAVLMLLISVGQYGSYGVFRFSEEFLTARTAAEAMIVASLACYYYDRKILALGVALAALLVHPLLALPGVLLIACLAAGPRVGVAAALGGIAATALLAATASLAPRPDGFLALIDGDWLTVVRERSQFLFLSLWRPADWKVNALPYASLGLTLLVVREPRIRRLAWAGMLVGASGLAVAWIASSVGPVAILIAGQAWRWVWIPSFLAILLLAPTLLAMWQDARCGPLAVIILLGGWTCTAVETWNCIGLVYALWLARPLVTAHLARLLRGTAVVLALVLLAWTLAVVRTVVGAPPAPFGREPAAVALAHNVLGVHTTAVMLAGLAYWAITRARSPWMQAGACLALAVLAALNLPGAIRQVGTAGTPAEVSAYADWRSAIPPGSNVAVIGVRNSTAFVWFTLDRPNYLSIDQSSGVVFSRATALEVKRRSEVLAPLVEPSWKIMSWLARRAGRRDPVDDSDRPLTAAALAGLCRDPQLGFVIAREDVGFNALRHAGDGPYRDWNLYDCRRVAAAGGPA